MTEEKRKDNIQNDDLTIETGELSRFADQYGGQLPKHIAVIMDGNGRWAQMRGKPRIFGHNAGASAVDRMVESCRYLGIEVLTLYAFSSQNWERPQDEVDGLMKLFMEYMLKEKARLKRNGIALRVIGDRRRLPKEIQRQIKELEDSTAKNNGMLLQVAVSYGGREEILYAATKLAAAVAAQDIDLDEIDETIFSNYLFTHGVPDPDLVIRTSGEQRISNFLLWQIAYAEIYFTSVLWPDFSETELVAALENYVTRQRRFGKTAEQLEAE